MKLQKLLRNMKYKETGGKNYMFSPYLKRIVIDMVLVIAFGMGIFYVYKVFLDFLISLFHFEGTRNLSSIAYCVYRILYILIPIIMLTIFKNMSKMRVFKIIFMAIGICYLVSNIWIINYMIDNNPIDLFYGSIPKWFSKGELGEIMTNSWNNIYLYQYNKAMVFNYLIWDTYDLFGVLFSIIQGILYIQLSLILDTSRVRVMRKYTLIIAVSILIPLLYNILIQGQWFYSSAWLNKNILMIFENLFILVALKLAASSRNFWRDILW